MVYFNINILENNDKRNKIYLKSSTYYDSEYFYTLDLINKKVFIGNTDKEAISKDFYKIANDLSSFNIENLQNKDTVELWVYLFILNLANAVNGVRSAWEPRNYNLFKRAFWNHSMYGNKLFAIVCSEIEKYSKLGLPLAESDFRRFINGIENSSSDYVDNKVLLKYKERDYTKPAINYIDTFDVFYKRNSNIDKMLLAELKYKENSKLESIYNSFLDIVPETITRRNLRLAISEMSDSILFLIETCRYDPRALYDYLTNGIEWQGLEPLNFNNKNIGYHSSFNLFYDYARMSYDIHTDTNFDKYPKYLHTVHDIVAKNYKIKENEIVSRNFMQEVEKHKKWDGFSNGNYTMVLPKEPSDLTKEGASLHHCVGSYISRVANKENFIIFCRLSSNLNQSFLTVDIKSNCLNQIEGMNRRSPSQKEIDFIKSFCRNFNIDTKHW